MINQVLSLIVLLLVLYYYQYNASVSILTLIFLVIYLCFLKRNREGIQLDTFIDSVDVLDHNNVITSADLYDHSSQVNAVIEEKQTSSLEYRSPEEVIIDLDGGETRVIQAYPVNQNIYEGFEKSQMGFPAGYFKIHSRVNGKCLDVNGGSADRGTPAILFDCHDGLNQQWYVDRLGRLKNRLSNRCLEVLDSKQANGTIVQIGNCSGQSNQQWSVDSVGQIKTQMNGSDLTFNEKDRNQSTPIYLWSDYNSPSQRWYFEAIDHPKQILRLLTSFDGLTDQRVQIPNVRLYPSNSYTYYFWLKITDPKYRQGEWKQLIYKGTIDTKVQSPGLLMDPSQPKFRFRIATTANENESCDPDYSIPKDQWIHVAYVLDENTLLAYVDARLIRRCVLQGTPNNNNHDVYIGLNGFGGFMKNIEYANYPMNQQNITDRMNQTQPEPMCLKKLPTTKIPDNLLKNSDLQTDWKVKNLVNVVYNEICPPDAMGGNTVTFTLKMGSSYYYCDRPNAPMKPDTDYRFSVWVKNDEPTAVNLRAYTGTDEQANDGHSRLWTPYQSVAKKDQWKQISWDFHNKVGSRAQCISIMFDFNKIPQSRISLFLPNLIEISKNKKINNVVNKKITEINIVKLSSNGSHSADDSCQPDGAIINAQHAWCAAQATGSQFYLQADFDQLYKVTEILTQGRPTIDQWVTEYILDYQIPSTDQWKRLGQSFKGNFDRKTIQKNTLDLVTNSVRLYPTKFHEWPSLRLGFKGSPYRLSQCDEYQNKSMYAKTDTEKEKYTQLFNQKCKKISYADHLKELQFEKNMYLRLKDQFKALKATGNLNEQQTISLENKVQELNDQLKRSHFEIKLARLQKCPPQKENQHESLKKELCQMSESLKKEDQQLRQKLINLNQELEKCRNEFNFSYNSISNCQKMSSNEHFYEHFSDPTQEVTVCTMESSPTKHTDFQKILANMMLKSDCAVPKKDLMKYITVDECNKKSQLPIEQHPQYNNLMKKYNVPSSGCPPKYTPCVKCPPCPDSKGNQCRELKDYPISQHPDFNNYISKAQAKTLLQTVSSQQKCKELKDYPINQHPDFKNYIARSEVKELMRSVPSKCAIKGTLTC